MLCNNFGFKVTGRKGSHVRLSKITQKGKVGTVVPMHKELKIGTLRGVLKLAKVDIDEFSKHL
nr:type II toxin-antitoxin system HicA family toxin [Candidatus Freyarchaeota archaeon]